MKKILAAILAAAMVFALAGCSNKNNGGGDTAKTEIYFLNFKPEIATVYDSIAKDYEAETGVRVKVVTAASGEYETTLTAQIQLSDAPTIFQINGPVGYESWKDYCLNLRDTRLYSYLSDQSIAIQNENGVFGIPYAVEGYGIMYNESIMNKYFESDGAKAKSMDEIKSFSTLQTVVEDMQSKKEQLGIDGVFAATSLSAGNQWRWQTHLANVPIYYEMVDADQSADPLLTGLAANEIAFKYSQNFKNVFDLYINNSSTPKTLLGSKSTNDSMAEFALGKVAMVQNGNWAWGEIKDIPGLAVKEDDIKYLPIYTGTQDEANQGLCVGTENYFAINAKVSEEKQQASIAFLEWLFSSDKGKDYVINQLGFIAPFNTFNDDEKPTDPLGKEVMRWMEMDNINTIPWVFAAFPSEEFKNAFGDALLEYAQGTKDWPAVVQVVVEQWKSERAK